MTLRLTAGEKNAAILGLGGYRPRRVVDNAEICTMIDSSDEWIRTRSGIIERRWAAEDETIQMMSVSAARPSSVRRRQSSSKNTVRLTTRGPSTIPDAPNTAMPPRIDMNATTV